MPFCFDNFLQVGNQILFLRFEIEKVNGVSWKIISSI